MQAGENLWTVRRVCLPTTTEQVFEGCRNIQQVQICREIASGNAKDDRAITQDVTIRKFVQQNLQGNPRVNWEEDSWRDFLTSSAVHPRAQMSLFILRVGRSSNSSGAIYRVDPPRPLDVVNPEGPFSRILERPKSQILAW